MWIGINPSNTSDMLQFYMNMNDKVLLIKVIDFIYYFHSADDSFADDIIFFLLFIVACASFCIAFS